MTVAEKILQAMTDYDQVYEAGKKTQYDEFWDAFQKNGIVKDYDYTFYGSSWNDVVYKPKYDLRVSSAYSTFSYTQITNIPSIIFDEKCTIAENTFSYLYSTHTIGKMVVHENLKFGGTFTQATALKNLKIEGVIGQNGLNLQWSTMLSKASITSIINNLSDTTSGLSITLSRTAKEEAFPDPDTAVPNRAWITLIGTKPNWTINLI